MEPGIAPVSAIRSSAETGELAKSLSAVIGSTSAVKKSGYNDFHKYQYATAADVQAEVRKALAEHGVALAITVANWDVGELKTRNGSDRLARITLAIRLTVECGQWIETDWIGEGQDRGDKAFYKAYTAALKYWSICTFLIPTGIDPEADTETDKNNRQQPSPARQTKRDQGPPPDDWRAEQENKPPPAGPPAPLADPVEFKPSYGGTWDQSTPDHGGVTLETYTAMVAIIVGAEWEQDALHDWLYKERNVAGLNTLDEAGAAVLLTWMEGKYKREQAAAEKAVAAQAELDAQAAQAADAEAPAPVDD